MTDGASPGKDGMADYFQLLDEPRRPWLEVEALKAKFLSRSSAVHPDRVHEASAATRQAAQQRYTELNAAFNCLREPKDRLRHLLELERGSPPGDVQQLPEAATEAFFEIGRQCREIDAFLAERAKVTSPLVRVQLLGTAQEWLARLAAMRRPLEARRDALLGELPGLNPAWETAPPPGAPGRAASLPLERLEQIFRELSYLHRWTARIQEREFQLAL